jgi:hypothetical protein
VVVLHTTERQQVAAEHLEEIQHLVGQAQAVVQMVLALMPLLIREAAVAVLAHLAHQLVRLLVLRLAILKNLLPHHLQLILTLWVLAVRLARQEQVDLLAALVVPV